MVVAANVKLGEVEVTQGDQEGVAESIEVGLSLSVVLTAGMTDEKEALCKGEMHYHVNDKENYHLFEHFND